MIKLHSLLPQEAVLLAHTPQGRRYRYGSDRDDVRHIAVWGWIDAPNDHTPPLKDYATVCQHRPKSMTTVVTRPVSR